MFVGAPISEPTPTTGDGANDGDDGDDGNATNDGSNDGGIGEPRSSGIEAFMCCAPLYCTSFDHVDSDESLDMCTFLCNDNVQTGSLSILSQIMFIQSVFFITTTSSINNHKCSSTDVACTSFKQIRFLLGLFGRNSIHDHISTYGFVHIR